MKFKKKKFRYGIPAYTGTFRALIVPYTGCLRCWSVPVPRKGVSRAENVPFLLLLCVLDESFHDNGTCVGPCYDTSMQEIKAI